jgi:DNA-binding transcriptional regulator YiaG
MLIPRAKKRLATLGALPRSRLRFSYEDRSDLLDSWKEIAFYLGRTVRTVQRWERLEHLPVRRHRHQRSGTVFAFKHEIDEWRIHRSRTEEHMRPPVLAHYPYVAAVRSLRQLLGEAGPWLLSAIARGSKTAHSNSV